MDRRDILQKCGAVGIAGSLGLLAGCSGGGEKPGGESEPEESASLEVTDFDYEEGDSGELVIAVTIENSGESEGTGHLYVTVIAAATTTEGDGEGKTATEDENTVASRESREVTVPAGETTTVQIPFEFTVDQFHRRGDLKIDLRT